MPFERLDCCWQLAWCFGFSGLLPHLSLLSDAVVPVWLCACVVLLCLIGFACAWLHPCLLAFLGLLSCFLASLLACLHCHFSWSRCFARLALRVCLRLIFASIFYVCGMLVVSSNFQLTFASNCLTCLFVCLFVFFVCLFAWLLACLLPFFFLSFLVGWSVGWSLGGWAGWLVGCVVVYALH